MYHKLHPIKFSQDTIPVFCNLEGRINPFWNQTQTVIPRMKPLQLKYSMQEQKYQWVTMVREEHGWERIYLASNSNAFISGNRSVTEAKGRRHYHNKAFVACWLFTSKTKKRGKAKGGLICLLKDPNS